jgi:glutathione S-transferase
MTGMRLSTSSTNSGGIEAARSRAGLDERRPATIAWLERIHARPAYQVALAKGRSRHLVAREPGKLGQFTLDVIEMAVDHRLEALQGKGDGRLGPPAHREAMQRWRFWLHYAEGSLMPPLFGSS